MKDLNLQYQLSNGMWVDCEERTSEFFQDALKNDYRKLDEKTAIEMLESGKSLCIGTDWYDEIRIKPEPVKLAPMPEFIPDNEEYGY